jgi:hypothetical protein
MLVQTEIIELKLYDSYFNRSEICNEGHPRLPNGVPRDSAHVTCLCLFSEVYFACGLRGGPRSLYVVTDK